VAAAGAGAGAGVTTPQQAQLGTQQAQQQARFQPRQFGGAQQLGAQPPQQLSAQQQPGQPQHQQQSNMSVTQSNLPVVPPMQSSTRVRQYGGVTPNAGSLASLVNATSRSDKAEEEVKSYESEQDFMKLFLYNENGDYMPLHAGKGPLRQRVVPFLVAILCALAVGISVTCYFTIASGQTPQWTRGLLRVLNVEKSSDSSGVIELPSAVRIMAE
jgi:hypothetical protein